MRRTTALESQWAASSASGQSLSYERCKGGYFSTADEYGLKAVGSTAQDGTPTADAPVDIQCVKAGTVIRCCGKNLVNIDDIQTYTYINASGNTVSRAGILFEEPGTYACKGYTQVTTNTYIYAAILSADDIVVSATKYIIANKNHYSPVITVEPGYKLFVYDAYGYGVSKVQQIFQDVSLQLEKNANTNYEPYVGNDILTPCDLYEGDTWYPMSGKVIRHNAVIESYNGESIPDDFVSSAGSADTGATIVYQLSEPTVEQYDPQPIFAPAGTVNVLQQPVDLTAILSATMLVRR